MTARPECGPCTHLTILSIIKASAAAATARPGATAGSLPGHGPAVLRSRLVGVEPLQRLLRAWTQYQVTGIVLIMVSIISIIIGVVHI